MTKLRNPREVSMDNRKLLITKPNHMILASLLGSLFFLSPLSPVLGQSSFQLVEASISDIHDAIRSEQITCRELTQMYVNRAKAYNGVCTQLVTENGASVRPAAGVVSAGTCHSS